MPDRLAVVAGAASLFYSGISSTRAFHICGPHIRRIDPLHLQCAPASGTTVRQPTPSWTPCYVNISVRSKRCRTQHGPRRSAGLPEMLASTAPSTASPKTEGVSPSTATRKPLSSSRTYSRYAWQPSGLPEMLASTAPSTASPKTKSVSPSTATRKPLSSSRTYSRYAWQPSSARSSGNGEKRSAPTTSTDPTGAVASQPLPEASSPPSTATGATPPIAGGAAPPALTVPAAATTPVSLDQAASELAGSEDWAMKDIESMLKRWKEIFKPFQRKIQDNIAEGNLGERGEEWAVAQALIVLFVVLNNIPVFGGIVLLLAGPGLLVGGVATSAVGVMQLGDSLSPWPAPTKENALKTDGIFGLVRHPTYSGLIMFCFGLGLTTSSPMRVLLAALLAVVIDKKTIKEEEMLVEMHGVAYEDYRNTVAKFVPRYY